MTLQRPLLRRPPAETPSPAEKYERHVVPLLSEPLARLFLRYVQLKDGHRVLDLACGTGVVSRLASPIVGPRGSIIGVDISADMLAVARRKSNPNGFHIDWRLGDAIDLPLGDEQFDVVLCQQGFQYFSDQEVALREIHRVLIPGGRLAICVARSVDAGSQPFQWAKNQALARHTTPGRCQSERQPVCFFKGSVDDLIDLISHAGFQEVKVTDTAVNVQMGPLKSLVYEDDYPVLSPDVRSAVVNEIQGAMRPFVNAQGVEIPYGMHIATAIRALQSQEHSAPDQARTLSLAARWRENFIAPNLKELAQLAARG